ncbi:hypothetical protein HCG49_16835 [Arenibacter sp. 6A1]|uniref:hypothetical protein n=1 Tax=Arenibacter sp. 6A1 TaxID=2720391 RepID=UPI0014478A52|nr:hypothetical protein [Arenibacter sp. 6A1]NKI28221.1 hypothetical protein [Arenibacter sp. 6A1]
MNKKTPILAIVALLIGFAVTAQTETETASDNVTLNVNLHAIQSITVNASQKTVDLDYKTTTDYATGVTLAQADHLSVYSTGGFQVYVKAAGTELTNASQINGDIAASDIKITATNGSAPIADVDNKATVSLTDSDQSILSTTKGAVNKNVNITYEAAGGDTYVDKYIAGQKPTTYTTQLTYTITAQ